MEAQRDLDRWNIIWQLESIHIKNQGVGRRQGLRIRNEGCSGLWVLALSHAPYVRFLAPPPRGSPHPRGLSRCVLSCGSAEGQFLRLRIVSLRASEAAARASSGSLCACALVLLSPAEHG